MVASTLTLGEPVTVLLSAASATGSFVQCQRGGNSILKVYGTFDSGTVTLESRASDGATAVPVTGVSMTAAGTVSLVVPEGDWVRAVITGAGGSAAISAEIRPV